MNVIGYPTPGKDKARVICKAFCDGAPGGKVVDAIPRELLPGAAVFYGVTDATQHLFDQCLREKRTYYYIDNAYFDPCRQVYFRVTRDALQFRYTESCVTDGRRFAALKLPDFKPQRERGKHVLVCPQSDAFMRICAKYVGSWPDDTVRALRKLTAREIRVRPWNGNKAKWYASLPQDLYDCHALVTWSSASAITALFAGVPAIVTSPESIAWELCGQGLAVIESPRFPQRWQLQHFAGVVADQQFTLDEMRKGLAWDTLERNSR